MTSCDFLQGYRQLWLQAVGHGQNASSVAFFSCATHNTMAPTPTKAWFPSPFPGPCGWLASLSLQSCKTARRIRVYVSFQSFTNTLVIWLFLATRGISRYKMHLFPSYSNLCILGVYYLSIHIFIWSQQFLLAYERMCFLYVAALTMMNTFKLCSTCLQKSPFASTSKAFFPSSTTMAYSRCQLLLRG